MEAIVVAYDDTFDGPTFDHESKAWTKFHLGVCIKHPVLSPVAESNSLGREVRYALYEKSDAIFNRGLGCCWCIRREPFYDMRLHSFMKFQVACKKHWVPYISLVCESKDSIEVTL